MKKHLSHGSGNSVGFYKTVMVTAGGHRGR